MSDFKVPFKLKLKISLRALGKVFVKPAYVLIAGLGALVVLGILVWIPNFGLLWDVLTGRNGLGDKINFFLDGYGSLFTNFETLPAITIVIFAILFGINLAILVFVAKGSVKSAAEGGGRSAVGIIAGAIGAGCAVCGTSFLAPVITGVGATASISLTQMLGYIINILGISLLTFSIYRLGLNASYALQTSLSAARNS